VTLVGVMNADTSLHLPDFRAGERTYQMLEQVAGRAGRGTRAGKVVIQTYWPDHPAIVAAACHDPTAFYAREKTMRAELGYPPFGRLANVLVWGSERRPVVDFSGTVAMRLADDAPDDCTVMGPSPAPLERLKGMWRWHVLLKAPLGTPLGELGNRALAAVARPNGVSAAIDVDPVDLL